MKLTDSGRMFELEAVIFDMDGLMYDSERIVRYSWDVAGEELGYEKVGDNIFHTLGMGAVARERYFRNRYGEAFPYERFKERYRVAFYDYANQYGIPEKPGLRELLDYLRDSGIPAAMATSTGKEDAMKRLSISGITHYFDCIITGDMVSETKPSPEIYLKACEGLGVEPDCAIALEDAANGIRSAHAAGMHPIMIPDLIKDISPVADLLMAKRNSLYEVIDLLKQK